MYGEIRTKIIDTITTLVTTGKLGSVYRTDRSQFSAYPAAVVVPSQNEADYASTAPDANKETYIFTIRVHYPITEGQDTADIALEGAIDELIETFRDRRALGDTVDWVAPVPSIWGYQDRPDGQMRVAELTIRAIKYVGV